MMKLIKIDCATRPSHCDLDEFDTCLYWREYTAGQGFNYSDTNQLILNLKKDISYQRTPHYRYKINAINTCASYFIGYDWSNYTIVPIPPSKAKTDPLYDDRLIRILESAYSQLPPQYRFNYQDIITQNGTYEASHRLVNRPSIDDLNLRYSITVDQTTQIKDNIVVFDDILTKGSHFKTIKSKLLEIYPQKNIIGLFIARTIAL